MIIAINMCVWDWKTTEEKFVFTCGHNKRSRDVQKNDYFNDDSLFFL